jgi:hypothetical protein
MPLLMRRHGHGGLETVNVHAAGGPVAVRAAQNKHDENFPAKSSAIFPRCANPRCASSWLRLWRSRSAPVFERGWCCSPECTRALVEVALSRELSLENSLEVRGAAAYRHRIPLGLAMLEKGWIKSEDLRRALEAQRTQGGRLGECLVRQGVVNESQLTRALAMQWSCPVLGIEWRDPEMMATLMPRLFVDALGALPLRIAAQRILYLGFEDRPDPVLAVALERMTGLRVESGVVDGSLFRAAHAQALGAEYAPVQLLEAVSESALARVLAGTIEKAQPIESRLVRVHDFVWLRMWIRRQTGVLPRRDEVRDLVSALVPCGDIA